MTQRHPSILLILMMLITPITSAFDHCVGMDMSVHLSNSQNTTVQFTSHDTSVNHHEKRLKNISESDYHNDTHCTVHLCGAYDIPSSPMVTRIISSSDYINIEYGSPYGIVLLPNLRPPRQIL